MCLCLKTYSKQSLKWAHLPTRFISITLIMTNIQLNRIIFGNTQDDNQQHHDSMGKSDPEGDGELDNSQ